MGHDEGDSLATTHTKLKGPTSLLILFVLNLIPTMALRVVGGIMMPFFIVISMWAPLYILTIVLTLEVLNPSSSSEWPIFWSRHSILVLVAMTVLPRAIFLGSDVLISLDAIWYLDFGKFMSWDSIPYADFYFPYPPVFGYFIYVIMLIAPAIDTYRLLAIGFDVLIVVSLWVMGKSRQENHFLAAAPFLYAVLPFSIIETGINGHFEPLANLFILLAIWALLEKREGLAAVSLGISIATKIYAIFILPILFLLISRNRNKLKFLVICAATFYATFIPFAFPVWARGDFLLPGAAMPGRSTGFFDALFGFIFDLAPIHLLTITIVGLSSAILIGVFMLKSTGLASVRNSLTYDILVFCIGLIFIVMAALAIVYPYLLPGPGVFWRYPTNIALARGVSTSLGAFLLLLTAWKRWRTTPNRNVSSVSLMLLASVAVLLIITMSKQVFYGWYCLWPLLPLLLLRDRRVAYAVLVCLLLIYPSYTNDNFASLGYDEVRTWSEEFSVVTPWNVSIDFGGSSLDPSAVNASIQPIDDIGVFSVDAAPDIDETTLAQVVVTWTLDVDIPVTNETEIVLLISSDWDPTFKKSADVDLYFEGLNETGHAVRDTVIEEWQFSPKNISYVLWRFTFLGTGVTAHPVELTRFELVASNIREPSLAVLIDYMYTTEVHLLTPSTIITGLFFAVPSVLAIVFIELRWNKLFPDDEDYHPTFQASSGTT